MMKHAILLSMMMAVGECLATDATNAAEPGLVMIMTFNIRYGTANDGPNHWDHRKEIARDLMRRVAADFVGVQEVIASQTDYLREQLPDYACLGRSREVDPAVGEACLILYREARWQLDPEEHGFFWLSETPEMPGSRSWETACSRMVVWGRFVDKKTGKAVYIFNTHLDHRSELARQNGAKLLAKRLAERKHDDPVFITGDFNAGEASVAVRYLTGKAPESPVTLVDTFRQVHPDAQDVGTYHGFKGGRGGKKIDYVLATPSVKTLEAEILHDNQNGRYPTDHFPVTAKVFLPE